MPHSIRGLQKPENRTRQESRCPTGSSTLHVSRDQRPTVAKKRASRRNLTFPSPLAAADRRQQFMPRRCVHYCNIQQNEYVMRGRLFYLDLLWHLERVWIVFFLRGRFIRYHSCCFCVVVPPPTLNGSTSFIVKWKKYPHPFTDLIRCTKLALPPPPGSKKKKEKKCSARSFYYFYCAIAMYWVVWKFILPFFSFFFVYRCYALLFYECGYYIYAGVLYLHVEIPKYSGHRLILKSPSRISPPLFGRANSKQQTRGGRQRNIN